VSGIHQSPGSTHVLPTRNDDVSLLTGDGARYHVPAALRALALLEYLASAQEPCGASFLARRLGIPKSSCFSLLLTLEQAGYVRRNGRDEWSLTLRIYHIGMRAARNLDVLVLAQPILQELVDDLGLTAHLGVFERGRVVYALKVETPGMVRFETYPGKPATLHLTAVGRAVASILGKRELDGLLDGYEFTPGANCAIRSRRAFMRELARVRSGGFAVEDEEETIGVACVAAPVSYADGNSAAAIGVTALAAQLQELTADVVGARVVDAANALSLLLGDRVQPLPVAGRRDPTSSDDES
jgi:DNA-binding IclR family transcriptional regulator